MTRCGLDMGLLRVAQRTPPFRNAIAMSALPPKADIPVFIELQSCPRWLALPEQTVGVPAVVELSEPGQVSERVFSTSPV